MTAAAALFAITSAALPITWAALVLAAAAPWRPAPSRFRTLRALGAPASPARSPICGAFCRLQRPKTHHKRLAAVAGVLTTAALVGPVPALVATALAAAVRRGLPVARRFDATRRHRAAVEAELPEVVDLLRLAVGAGLTVPWAVAAVATRAPGPVGSALAGAFEATTRGRRLADALDELPGRIGEGVRPLAATLAGSERYGHPIGPALERLAAEARDHRRRQAERAARRVPVLLLFPLVLCILPAFALLTVAPLLASAVQSLRL